MWPNHISAIPLNAEPKPGTNLLTNPGHEPPAVFYKGRAEVYVAWNWVPFWDDATADKAAKMPQFRPAFAANEPSRVRSGEGADRYFNYFSINKNAGLMQTVEGLPAGNPVRFTSWVQVHSSDSTLQVRLCIDQDGGVLQVNDPAITCSTWAKPNNQWAQLSVDGVTKGATASAIIWSRAETAVEHNDVYVDDSCFERLNNATDKGICKGGAPALAATPTPFANPTVRPTLTPNRNATRPAPTRTVAPNASSPSVTVVADGINVRQQPSQTARILGGIRRGTVLPVIGRSVDGQWFAVLYKGAGGWVFASLVQPNAAAKNAPVVK
jgi:SH3-like domain-containing protein